MWREGLFYKMIIAGIPNKIFQKIYSMYQDTRFRIKFSNGVGNEFFSTCGVKQGDVLSPLLFIFLIEDLVKKLNISNCDPVVIKIYQLTHFFILMALFYCQILKMDYKVSRCS